MEIAGKDNIESYQRISIADNNLFIKLYQRNDLLRVQNLKIRGDLITINAEFTRDEYENFKKLIKNDEKKYDIGDLPLTLSELTVLGNYRVINPESYELKLQTTTKSKFIEYFNSYLETYLTMDDLIFSNDIKVEMYGYVDNFFQQFLEYKLNMDKIERAQ